MIFDCIERRSNIGKAFETTKLNRLARVNFFDLLALVIEHESDFTFMYSTNEYIFLFKCALLDQNCGSNLGSLLIEV